MVRQPTYDDNFKPTERSCATDRDVSEITSDGDASNWTAM